MMSASADRRTEAVRLFYALVLPPAAQIELARWSDRALGSVAGLRLVAPEALHLTLCFLGSQPADAVEEIAQAGRAAAASFGAVELSCDGVSWLPPRRPAVVAVRLAERRGPGVARLQGLLAAALSEGGWYELERRPFLPHVTVARVRRGAHVQRTEIPPSPAAAFVADRVALYRSRPSAAGSRYEELAAVTLGRGALSP